MRLRFGNSFTRRSPQLILTDSNVDDTNPLYSRISEPVRDLCEPMRTPISMSGAQITAIQLVCHDVAATTSFYSKAFDCRPAAGNDMSSRLTRLMLGEQFIEFVATGSRSLTAARSNSTAFQHCAIVVSDMPTALKRLGICPGWSAISRCGAETLRQSSGGVIAFKFRDPEGHPLEFLRFPDDCVPAFWKDNTNLFLGIDHSAITTANTEQAARFYANLGFSVTHRQMNEGSEQQRLDDVAAPLVEVTALEATGSKTPHLELLHYRQPETVVEVAPVMDIRSTRLVLDVTEFRISREFLANSFQPVRDPELTDVQESWLRDQDGHILIVREGSIAKPAVIPPAI
jgi:catechol 2,3-dioxygenase-like lactoylglutathione lyase family enzyme/predicted enzyme related to lactoylglutathione lyase